jgi:predicted metal-dependent hydrolase
MLRPRRFEHEYDPGPVQLHARKVHFDVTDIPLHWIPGHPGGLETTWNCISSVSRRRR